MKVMSRNFTTTEKALLIVLALILVGLIYYQFVDRTVRASIEASEAEYRDVHVELDAIQQRIAYLQGIQNSLDALKEGGNLSWMGSYNNSKQEVAFLNDILADTLEYSITFADVTRAGNQIRRSFTLQYRTQGYEAAQNIMSRLLAGQNRCLVGNVYCTINKNDGTVVMNQSATFYETMVGGTADAALPESKAQSVS